MARSVSFRVALAVGFTLGVTALGALVVRLHSGEVRPDLVTNAMTKSERVPSHKWRSVDGKHWQVVAGAAVNGREIDTGDPSGEGEDPEITDKAEGTRGNCTAGMVEVSGNMMADPAKHIMFDPDSIEEMQKTTCTKWLQKEYPERCTEFDKDKWLAMTKDRARKPMHYCMDRFEYPNRKGAYPVIYINFNESAGFCKAQGKRLCTEEEWTFACEGEEATPYPYGYTRDATACDIDQKWRAYDERAMQSGRDSPLAMLELDRLWQGGASGERPACRSVFGVYDMTGNVDEWTRTVREGERPSILKGGYWGPVRTRCRPSTRGHDESHVFYQQGFRCCSDAPKGSAGGNMNQYETPLPTNLDPTRKTSGSPAPSASVLGP